MAKCLTLMNCVCVCVVIGSYTVCMYLFCYRCANYSVFITLFGYTVANNTLEDVTINYTNFSPKSICTMVFRIMFCVSVIHYV